MAAIFTKLTVSSVSTHSLGEYVLWHSPLGPLGPKLMGKLNIPKFAAS